MSIFILAFPMYIFISDYIKINVKKHAKLRKKHLVLFLIHVTFISF